MRSEMVFPPFSHEGWQQVGICSRHKPGIAQPGQQDAACLLTGFLSRPLGSRGLHLAAHGSDLRVLVLGAHPHPELHVQLDAAGGVCGHHDRRCPAPKTLRVVLHLRADGPLGKGNCFGCAPLQQLHAFLLLVRSKEAATLHIQLNLIVDVDANYLSFDPLLEGAGIIRYHIIQVPSLANRLDRDTHGTYSGLLLLKVKKDSPLHSKLHPPIVQDVHDYSRDPAAFGDRHVLYAVPEVVQPASAPAITG
mmetsp:Transcript_30428/g.66773  ORF Transcript_30428/g.66773 Transcript_30428/m.66773 type:complete len:249 (-) Transcript_30428:773-1519(-)